MTEQRVPCVVVASFVGYPGLSSQLVYSDQVQSELDGEIVAVTARYPERDRVHPFGVIGRIEKLVRLPDQTQSAQVAFDGVFEIASLSSDRHWVEGRRSDLPSGSQPVESDRNRSILELLERCLRSRAARDRTTAADLTTCGALVRHVMATIHQPPLGRRYGYKVMDQTDLPADEVRVFQDQIARRVALLGEPDERRRLDLVEQILRTEL
jgi:hypothetical protein